MPILASKLLSTYPPTEEERKQLVDCIASASDCFRQQITKITLWPTRFNLGLQYSPPPFTPPTFSPPVQKQCTTIDINLTIELTL